MMSIIALALFGSCARGDNDNESDVDILAVTPDFKLKRQDHKNLSISFYTEIFLKNRAENGNLFVLHLITEAKVLFDPTGLFELLRKSFCAKPNYSKEIQDASMLGWFLIVNSRRVKDWALFNKRLAWCVRTISIAKAFEQGSALFSAKSISDFYQSDDIFKLIRNKSKDTNQGDRILLLFARFLLEYGCVAPKFFQESNLSDQLKLLRQTENRVGQVTATAIFGGMIDDYVVDNIFEAAAE